MTKEELMPVTDKVAEELEKAGLYRRAATRWLQVFFECPDDAERAWISRRRRDCLSRTQVVAIKSDESYLDVCRAVRAVHREMGLSPSSASAYHSYRIGRRRG